MKGNVQKEVKKGEQSSNAQREDKEKEEKTKIKECE